MTSLAPTDRISQCPDAVPAVWFLVGQLSPVGHGGEQAHIPINASRFSIGRHPDSSLCLPFRTVSSKHAEILTLSDKLILRDLGSTNGTYINGRRLCGEAELEQDSLVQFAEVALRLQRQTGVIASATIQEDVYDQALALVQFDKLMSQRQVTPYYQPIVDLASVETIAFEVLGRSRLYGVETPYAMFRAAAKLNLEVQLSHMLRWEGILKSAVFPTPPHLFVNTHPRELVEEGLIEAMRAVREIRPLQPLTLEIHEGAITDVKQMIEIRAALADLDVRLAFDDFGAGQARLVELVNVKPDYLKFDIALIRDLDAASTQTQQMVSSLVRMTRDIGIVPLAEGVEREQEAAICRDLGFELGQGFYFGKPAPGTCF